MALEWISTIADQDIHVASTQDMAQWPSNFAACFLGASFTQSISLPPPTRTDSDDDSPSAPTGTQRAGDTARSAHQFGGADRVYKTELREARLRRHCRHGDRCTFAASCALRLQAPGPFMTTTQVALQQLSRQMAQVHAHAQRREGGCGL